MSEEEPNLKFVETESRWVSDNLEQLKAQYEGQVFAIRGKQVIASSDSIVLLVQQLQEMGENLEETVIESIPPRNLAFIL